MHHFGKILLIFELERGLYSAPNLLSKLFCEYLELTMVRFWPADTKSYKPTFVLQMQISTEPVVIGFRNRGSFLKVPLACLSCKQTELHFLLDFSWFLFLITR